MVNFLKNKNLLFVLPCVLVILGLVIAGYFLPLVYDSWTISGLNIWQNCYTSYDYSCTWTLYGGYTCSYIPRWTCTNMYLPYYNFYDQHTYMPQTIFAMLANDTAQLGLSISLFAILLIGSSLIVIPRIGKKRIVREISLISSTALCFLLCGVALSAITAFRFSDNPLFMTGFYLVGTAYTISFALMAYNYASFFMHYPPSLSTHLKKYSFAGKIVFLALPFIAAEFALGNIILFFMVLAALGGVIVSFRKGVISTSIALVLTMVYPIYNLVNHSLDLAAARDIHYFFHITRYLEVIGLCIIVSVLIIQLVNAVRARSKY